MRIGSCCGIQKTSGHSIQNDRFRKLRTIEMAHRGDLHKRTGKTEFISNNQFRAFDRPPLEMVFS
jgi:hypothetical protein